MSKDLVTISQAANLKGVSRTAVYDAIKAGRLPHTFVLGRRALHMKDVLAWKVKKGRPAGQAMSNEQKKSISASQKQRWAKRKAEGTS